MLTRDSVVFSWWAIVAAILTYLATAGDPRAWDYMHWLNSAVAVGGIIAGKLGQSPLPHSDDVNTVKGGGK